MLAFPALVCLDPRRVRPRVFGFQGGLVFRNSKGEVGAAAWERITGAGRALKDFGEGPRLKIFTVQLTNGETWPVDGRSYPRECLNAIRERVERELTARRLPEAEARIAGGGQVECAGAVVDATGITVATLTMHWSEVRRVVDDFGVVRVLTTRGWRELFRGGKQPTPDVYLLVALTRRLARG
jgi:hypothetical protein